MRRLLLWTTSAGLALSGTLVMVLLVRAAMLTPVPRPEGEPLPFAFDELGAPLRLAAALGVLGEGEGPGLAAVLETGFPLLHATLRREPDAAGTLLYEWPGSDPALPSRCPLRPPRRRSRPDAVRARCAGRNDRRGICPWTGGARGNRFGARAARERRGAALRRFRAPPNGDRRPRACLAGGDGSAGGGRPRRSSVRAGSVPRGS